MARVSERQSLSMVASCRTSASRTNVEVIDLAPGGCGVVGKNLQFYAGQMLVIKPEEVEGKIGIVRWTTSERAGIEFEHPYHVAIVDHFVKIHSGDGS